MIVSLKQTPDQSAESVGLSKYNKSVLPNTFQMYQPYFHNGRWFTGLDEDSVELRKRPDYAEKKEEVKELRESLEKVTGLDLKATSSYWDNYRISFSGGLTLDLDNPEDRIRYHVLTANNFAAPNADLVNQPEYNNAKFYLSRTEEEESNKAKVKRSKNQAIAELTKIEENKNRLLILAKFIFGNAISDDATMDSLYNLLSDYINDDKKGADIRKFNDAVQMTTEQLQIKITIDEAIRFNVIRQRDGVYQRGNITLGKDTAEVLRFLSKVENSGEFASIMEEVREKRIMG
jgi:hypothetical protein